VAARVIYRALMGTHMGTRYTGILVFFADLP